MRVLAALSGGVDSSVAAALAVAAGHDVVWVTLKLWSGPGGEAPTAGCCTVSDAEDARRVAAVLDIPYYVLDYTDDFRAGVVDRFVAGYAGGRTPNPCIECNRTVKFSRLLDQAADLDCELLVTGHYARVGREGGRWTLLRGADRRKDQSYVLSMLGQAELARVSFPVGGLDKAGTRRIAADLGLRTAAKPESQDICFVGAGDYRDFLRDLVPAEPGPVVDVAGTVVGRHDGVAGFTVGQRRGLGAASGGRRYVVEVRPETATVVVGRREDLAVDALTLEGMTSVSGEPVSGPLLAQYRAHGDAVPAVLAGNVLTFASPETGVAPGQTVALYDGEAVRGSGIIAATRAAGQSPRTARAAARTSSMSSASDGTVRR